MIKVQVIEISLSHDGFWLGGLGLGIQFHV